MFSIHPQTIPLAHVRAGKNARSGSYYRPTKTLCELDTENELYQAKRSYINAEYDLAIAEARTLAGMGKLVSALDISRLEISDLPELIGSSADGAENCPANPPTPASIDKEKLDARAIEQAKEAIQEAQRKAVENTASEREKLDTEDKSFLNTPGAAAAVKPKPKPSKKALINKR